MQTNPKTKRGHSALMGTLCGLVFSNTLAADENMLPGSLRNDAQEMVTAYLPVKTVPIITPKLTPWHGANQRVGELGGWLFYATEAATEGDNPHEGHQKKEPAAHEGHQ